jgi:hypothetical protein
MDEGRVVSPFRALEAVMHETVRTRGAWCVDTDSMHLRHRGTATALSILETDGRAAFSGGHLNLTTGVDQERRRV